jgi:hypothetical protein
MRYSIAVALGLCAGLLAGCADPNFAYPHLLVPGNTPAERNAYQQAESQKFDPYLDPSLTPNLINSNGGLRPLGYDQPREPYPVRPAPAPVIVTPAQPGTVTAPYPSSGACPTTAPGWFPAASPAPYPGATPNGGISPSYAPTPGPAPAPYELK